MSERQPLEARGYRIFEWINTRILLISIVMFVVAITLGVIAPIVAEKGDPSFDPTGEIYDTDDLVVDRFFSSDSPIRGVSFVVEVADVPESPTAQDHDVLTAAALFEFKQNADAVRATYSTGADAHLLSGFDFDLGIEIDGIFVTEAIDLYRVVNDQFGGL